MTQLDAQYARIEAIVGDDEELSFEDCIEKFHEHLTTSLQLPCDVTGIEDFRWEEYYVVGPGDPKEHGRLRKKQPSFEDTFELLAIEADVYSEWMMFCGEDLAGHVRRKSDGKEFWLGLAEIEPVDKNSKNDQLLNDYAVWFVNNRSAIRTIPSRQARSPPSFTQAILTGPPGGADPGGRRRWGYLCHAAHDEPHFQFQLPHLSNAMAAPSRRECPCSDGSAVDMGDGQSAELAVRLEHRQMLAIGLADLPGLLGVGSRVIRDGKTLQGHVMERRAQRHKDLLPLLLPADYGNSRRGHLANRLEHADRRRGYGRRK